MKPSRHQRAAVLTTAGLASIGLATTALAQDNKLKIITWADYVPAEVVAQFKKETGIDVEVTLSNNEEMISKLRATGGGGVDLLQPPPDRLRGAPQGIGIYQPTGQNNNKTGGVIPSRLGAPQKKKKP